MIRLMILTFVLTCHPVAAYFPRNYTVDAFSCSQPTIIHAYDALSACNQSHGTSGEGKSRRITLLKKVDRNSVKSFKCELARSKFLIYCGAYSHMKLLRPPILNEAVKMSAEECKKISRTRIYTLPTGKSYPLTVNVVTNIPLIEHGSVNWEANNMFCQGTDVMYHGELHKNVLVYTTLVIKVTEVVLDTNREAWIDQMSQVQLPDRCMHKKTCETDTATYVDVEQPPTCQLERVRTITMRTIIQGNQEIYVDDDSMLVLQPAGLAPVPEECGVTHVHGTQFNVLFVTEDPNVHVPDLESINLDYDTALAVQGDYIRFRTDQLRREAEDQISTRICRSGVHLHDVVPVTQDGRVLRRRGDLVQQIQCQPVRVIVAVGTTPSSQCYPDHLPGYWNGELILINSETRVITPLAQVHQANCSQDDTVFLLDSSGAVFLYANPEIRAQPKGSLLSRLEILPHHSSEYKGTSVLYTSQEYRQLHRFLLEHHARKSVRQKLLDAACDGGRCGGYNPGSTAFLPSSSIFAEVPKVPSVEQWFHQYLSTPGLVGGWCFLIYLCISIQLKLLSIFRCTRVPTRGADPASVNIALTPTSQPTERDLVQPEQIHPAPRAVTFSDRHHYI